MPIYARWPWPAAPARGPQPALDAAQVRERIKADIQLRAVPAVLHHVLALTNRSASSFADVAQALRADPALALRVMRVANSSLFATSKPAANLTEAAQRIGMTGIQNAITAVLAIEHFDVSSAGGLTPQRFWEHSVATAVLTDEIRLAAKLPDSDTLFLGALMHDIGKVVLSTLYPEAYRWVIEEAVRASGGLRSVEESVFGLGHAEVAGDVLRCWGMPEDLIGVVECHELSVAKMKTCVSDPKRGLAIALADRMAHALLMGEDGQAVLSPLHEPAHALGLSAQAILDIAKSAADKTTDMGIFYSAHGMGQTSPPLAKELSGEAKVKVAVLARLGKADPLALMFDRMGWIEPAQPEVAVLHVLSRAELGSKLQALSKLEGGGATGGTPVIVASPDASIVPERAELGGRACVTVSVPGPYASILGQVLTLRQTTGEGAGGNAMSRVAQAALS